MVKAKKYFYVIRPILACKWILKNQTPPPMLFSTLVESVLEENMKTIIYDLLKLKTELPEIGEIPKITALNDYIDKNLEELKQEIDKLPNTQNNSFDELNKLFLSALE